MSTATLALPESPPDFSAAAMRTHARSLANEPAKPSAASLLRAASKGSAKAKKASGYEYDGNAEEQAAEILHLKRTIDEQEREIKLKKSELRRFLDPWYHDKLRTSGYESTVRVPAGNGGDALLLTYQHRYSVVPLELEEHLRGLVGQERFDRYFKPTASLKLKKEVAEDPERLNEVVLAIAEAIGPQRFATWFEAAQGLAPTKSFTEQRWNDLDDATNDRIAAFGVEQIVAFKDGSK